MIHACKYTKFLSHQHLVVIKLLVGVLKIIKAAMQGLIIGPHPCLSIDFICNTSGWVQPLKFGT